MIRTTVIIAFATILAALAAFFPKELLGVSSNAGAGIAAAVSCLVVFWIVLRNRKRSRSRTIKRI